MAASSTTVVNTYTEGNSSFIWTLTADTSVQDMLLLIDTNTALPVTHPAKTIPYIGNSRLEDMDLLISFVSQTTNDQSGIVWETSRTWVANVSSSTGVVSPYATGSAVIKATHTSAYNTVQYTVTVAPHTATSRFVNLDVIYDEGHTERHGNSIERIGPQLAELQRIYWDEFGIFVNYSTPTQYHSLADSCPSDIDEACTCPGKCENSYSDGGTLCQKTNHHRNIYNIHADIDLPNKAYTLRIAYTGYDEVCKATNNGCEKAESLYGLAIKDWGTALVRDTIDIEHSKGFTVHEFGHLYGAVDHYKGENTTEKMNARVEGNPYSSNCIYGEKPYEDGRIIICEGCWDTINDNRNIYNHNEEG